MNGQVNNGSGRIGTVGSVSNIGSGGNGSLLPVMTSPRSWIKQFCHAQPLLVEIDRSFIEDAFNLYGLKQLIADYATAMSIILDKKRKFSWCEV